MRSVDVFYNFMIMDANRNVFWRDPTAVDAERFARMNAVWGDNSWRASVYPKTTGLFGEMEEKAPNEDIAEAFRQRMMNVAGFKYVAPPMPMRNSNGAVLYYLFFASPNSTGAKIVGEIFSKYRSRGVS